MYKENDILFRILALLVPYICNIMYHIISKILLKINIQIKI